MIRDNSISEMSFTIAAILICITCLFYTAVMRGTSKKILRSRLFIVLIIITLIDCFTGVITEIVYATNMSEHVKFVIAYVCKMTYYLTHFALIPIYSLYIIIVCDVLHHFSKKGLVLLFVPFIYLELAALTNPWTGFIFVYDSNLEFYRGEGVSGAYLISGLYALLCGFLLLKYWQSMNKLQKIAMFYFMGLAVLGTVIQMLFPNVVCELMAESLGLMGLMIMIERDDYRLDYMTHANNRVAFVHDINVYYEFKRKFYMICVRIPNSETYRRVMGYEAYDNTLREIADFLKNIKHYYDVYRTTGGNFYMLCPDSQENEIYGILDQIENRFKQSFNVQGGNVSIMAKILCAKCPDEINSSNDAILFAESELEDIEKTVLKGKDLDFLMRKIDIEKAIVRGMAGETFRVFYQPVYDKDTKRISSAEALLTLNDVELGEVPFSEFLSVAEEAGFVAELEHRMIESVCKFISGGVEHSGMNVKTIVIHIMSVQVLQPELTEKVRLYIRKYRVNPSILVFDVSDTIVIQAQEVLGMIIDDFKKMGIHFVLVNNDSGFLGIHHSIVDKFDGVAINIDKHFAYSDNEQSDIILKNRSAMIRQLGKLLILSSINTKEQYKRTEDVIADCIVGDYLCKMVSKNELQNKFWHHETFEEKE